MTSSFSSNTMAGIAAQLGASKPVPVSFGWGWLGKGQGFVALAPDGFRLSGTVGGKQVEASVPRSAVQAATWKRQRVLMKIDRASHAPPTLRFEWKGVALPCVLEGATEEITSLFPDGRPARARLHASFKETRTVAELQEELARE